MTRTETRSDLRLSRLYRLRMLGRTERHSLTTDSASGNLWVALSHFNLLPSIPICWKTLQQRGCAMPAIVITGRTDEVR